MTEAGERRCHGEHSGKPWWAGDVVTLVNVNNHFEGSAPRSIGRLLEALAREGSG